MADEFDRLLTAALAPAEREPDRRFVARVQAQIALEEQFAAERRLLLWGFAKQMVALIAVAAGVWWFGRAAPVASWFAESPAIALATMVTGFAFVVAVLSSRPSDDPCPRAAPEGFQALSAFMILNIT